MPFEDVLVHRATPLLSTKGDPDTWVEGESADEQEVPGSPFDCCLFLPQGSEDGEKRGRGVREPTLLFLPENDEGEPVALSREDQLDVVAPELNVVEGRAADAVVRWQVAGAAQPFGKPGEDVIGFQVTLRKIGEGENDD